MEGHVNAKESIGDKRETWAHKREYILSMLGYSVGFGTLLRFPYLCNRNGGGAFLIPYFTAIIACSVPLFFLEVSISQFSSRSATHVWVLCPLFKGIGISQILRTIFGVIPDALIMTWVIYYLSQSFRSVLPWTTCDNWWNTPVCIKRLTNDSSYVFFNSTVEHQLLHNAVWRKPNSTLTASEEYWQFNALRVSTGIDKFGTVQPHMLLSLLCSWTIVFLCLMRGVRSVGKVVYVTAVMPYILLTVLLIRSCMMPGSVDGLLYFLRPDFSRLGSVQVWLEALLQAFYSMGTTFGTLNTVSSYNKFHNNCLRDVAMLTISGEASSIFSGLVVFSTLGFMAHEAQIPMSDVVSSGAGLGFIIYPEAIAKLPVPQLWSVLFFLTLLSLGIDTLFGAMETIIAGISEAFPKHLMKRRILVTAGVCLCIFLLSIPYATQGGVYLFQLLDWYASSFNVLFIGCLECLVISWIYGSKRFTLDVEMMLGRRTPLVLSIMLSYITPVILFAALILSLFMYDPPSYGAYVYPDYAKVVGILMAVVMTLPILFMMIYQIVKRDGTIIQRLKLATVPSLAWGPARTEHRKLYLERDHQHGVLMVPVAMDPACLE
ncbi:sodium- and chloride-dependent glycine transporter 1-like [Haliotis rufescens]|uniref:sodium- and chloride-dependent glycine transporter 1-like n=1 Tax=Haliotis rufescens TaxID=6454 RepID=UPI00201ED56C|nr:sodium- and chloride-dependent glycine transporter 1-like [Haliotis rufescens]XP_046367047.2 sodium- and chloride-dependent glycine transporter 1-like [Haliotis rufescens]XP_048253843.1 sodium- and chloride-dependent glycine transporter 1-like [Haliotis rufescens]